MHRWVRFFHDSPPPAEVVFLAAIVWMGAFMLIGGVPEFPRHLGLLLYFALVGSGVYAVAMLATHEWIRELIAYLNTGLHPSQFNRAQPAPSDSEKPGGKT